MKQDHTKLSLEERVTLFRLLQQDCSKSEIARVLGRHRSTVKRELDRNTPKHRSYLPEAAQRTASARRYRGNRCARNEDLATYIENRLEWGWSPEQIAGLRPTLTHGDAVSHEAIYRFIYDSSRGRRNKLHKRLWRGKGRRVTDGARSLLNVDTKSPPNLSRG